MSTESNWAKWFYCIMATIVVLICLLGILALLYFDPCALTDTRPESIRHVYYSMDNRTRLIFDGHLVFDVHSQDRFRALDDMISIHHTDITPHFFEVKMVSFCATIRIYPVSTKGYDLIIETFAPNGELTSCIIKSLQRGDVIRSCVNKATGLVVAFLNVTLLTVENDYNRAAA